ncbi:MAG: tyrosine-type recombinase/integrase [Lachnospiraceae bacterium]|nr:tyrosine-type recombinase/integrase [Lachnospiraceae bacterium]
MEYITEESIREFENTLTYNEKARATVQKYIAVLRVLAAWLGGEELTKPKLLAWREALLEKKKAKTVNGALSAVNAYLRFRGLEGLRVHFVRVQRASFVEESRELTEAEYKRLLDVARRKGDERLYFLMMTLAGTGIRISELPYITVEAVAAGRAEIYMKGKSRTVLLPRELRRHLREYIKRKGIREGVIFRTRSGRPMDRSNIGPQMKRLCEAAGVDRSKVFPHNFRHLFARCFYAVEKNLAHLADVLGHSRIETTRIYVAVSAASHERVLEQMRLVV